MASLLRVGQVLRGRVSAYTVTKELYRAGNQVGVYQAITSDRQKCILKSLKHSTCLETEAAILHKYQSQCPSFRPVLDVIENSQDPPSIVLKHLDSDLLAESGRNRLSRPEIKQVAKSVLEALHTLHQDGMIHTSIKLESIFVDTFPFGNRFTAIQLGDFGAVVHKDSDVAKQGYIIGTSFTRSPEVMFSLPWGPETDIWSFGTAILELIYGRGFRIFDPSFEGVKADDESYDLVVLGRIHGCFGPFPDSYLDLADENALAAIGLLNQMGPPAKPFQKIARREVPPADRDFILKIMKLDPRDRPTAEQLLQDEWFTEESEDTREPL